MTQLTCLTRSSLAVAAILAAASSTACSSASSDAAPTAAGGVMAASGGSSVGVSGAVTGSGGATTGGQESVAGRAPTGGGAATGDRVPTLIVADIYYPPDDVDDHVDLIVALRHPRLDLLGLVLDGGHPQQVERGRTAMQMLEAATGVQQPLTVGLQSNLATIDDPVLGDTPTNQAGVELILSTLAESQSPLTIVTQGSLRDVAAAFNRDPELFRQKLDRLVVFIGDADESATGPDAYGWWTPNAEWNVHLDPLAFAAILRSGLPVYWVPCFEGGQGSKGSRASYWHARGSNLTQGVSEQVRAELFLVASQSYYANNGFPFDRAALGALDPAAFVQQPLAAEHAGWFDALNVQMWIGGLYAVAAKEVPVLDGNWRVVPEVEAGEHSQRLYTFEATEVSVADDGLSIAYGDGSHEVMQFRYLVDQPEFDRAMTEVTRQMLAGQY